MFASKDTLLTRPSGGYTIARSVRLRSSATAYFNRTPATATNQKVWTWSGWVKRGALGTEQSLFATVSQGFSLFFGTGNDLRVWTNGGNGAMYTSAVYRDVGAWYHIVLQRTSASPYFNLYVNGVQVTAFAFDNRTTYPGTSNSEVNSTVAHYISGFTSYYFDGYLTEINFIDGQALTPSSFGETDSITGVWKPKAYSGTYGTNGFELNFSDNSNNTAATIGKDYSGNGNNWTPNNISVTAGVTYDSMVDSPTVGSLSSNYCVWNPLSGTTGTVSEGNLYFVGASSYGSRLGTIALPTSTKIYFEATLTVAPYTPRGSTSAYNWLGVALSTNFNITSTPAANQVNGLMVGDNGYLNNFASSASDTGTTFVVNDIIGFAIDTGANTYTIYRNNSSIASGTIGVTAGTSISPMQISYNADGGAPKINFGQRPFSYTPPTGFVALNTYNLPASTITNGAAYMAATTYTGTGATQSITNTVGSTSFQPDFVWIKDRSAARSHRLFDSVRGATKALFSDATDAETTLATDLTAFNTTGFALGAGAGSNSSGETFVGWQWKASNTTASNTNGSITSTVSVGATQGFSVVTYTGTGANATVGHGLGVAPQMIIVKCRSNTSTNWTVYHTSLGNTGYIYLNLTNAAGTGYSGFWNNTSPTSSVFSLGSDVDGYVNGSGRTNVAYCFASVAGFSSVGSYTGNGSTDGPMIYLGFKPRWFMSKRSDTAGNDWVIMDTSRDTYNVAQKQLYADLSNAEEVNSAYDTDFLSNGLKIRTSTASRNASGSTYIYIAFAENPLKYSLAQQETIMFKHNNTPIPLDTPFTIDGTSYPANWLRLTSLAEKQAVGIEEVADVTTTYNDQFYWGVDNPKLLNDREESDEDGNPMYVKVLGVVDGKPAMVDSTERLVTKGLKSNWTAQVKDTANKLLAQTDWMVIRKAERDVAIPTATATYRAAVITECSRLVTAIAGASDVEAFIAVVTSQAWPNA